MSNTKRTSPAMGSTAGKTLADPNSSAIQKSFAASALAQAGTNKQTGADMEAKAGRALQSDKYADTTHTLAGSLVSQANKHRR